MENTSEKMEKAIRGFGEQFDYIPEIISGEKIKSFKKIVVLGMGGSHLAADVLGLIDPEIDLYIHRDYGLPKKDASFFADALIVASSYSGNTEEVVEGLEEALQKKLNAAVISVGGKLIEIAKADNVPFIQLPDTKVQPRSALGFSFVALAHLLQNKKALAEIEEIKGEIKPETLIEEGKRIALDINDKTPIIYTSASNYAIAYNWKIKFNETGKVPAFYNVFPELNHNEMTGFDFTEKTQRLANRFLPIFIFDPNDNQHIQKRMEVTKSIYESKFIECMELKLEGRNPLEKVFNSLLIADWAAYFTAMANDAEANEVPMVEDFKKRIG